MNLKSSLLSRVTSQCLLTALFTSLLIVSCRAQRQPATRVFDARQLETVDHRISPEQAISFIRKYETERNTWVVRNMPLSEAFNKRQVDSLLQQENCVGIRVSYGIDDKGKVRIILLGIGADGKDIGSLEMGLIQPKQNGGTPYYVPPVILESGQRCPEVCP